MGTLNGKSQTDIVNKMLRDEGKFEPTTQKVKLPGLVNRFIKSPEGKQPKVLTMKVRELSRNVKHTRKEQAELIASFMISKKGIVGLEWEAGEDKLLIKHVEGFHQLLPQHAKEEEDLVNLISLILRCKKNITYINWDLQDPFVEITWLPFD